MFPDSKIAKNLKISITEVSYMVAFELAEYFHESLINLAEQSAFFLLLSDGSPNQIINIEQMDLQTRLVAV